MNITTFEEARKCPKCKVPMVEVGKSRATNGNGTVHVLECQMTLCSWFQERKIVQVMDDGTVPVRDRGDKEFPAMTPGQLSAGRINVENAIQREHTDDSEKSQ